MPRDAIIPVQTVSDTGKDGKNATISTAITVANGAYIDVSSIDTDHMIIHVKNTVGAAKTVTVKAGVYSRASLGDLVVSVAATTGEQLIKIESARFKQANGQIFLDWEAAMTGSVAAYLV